MEKLNILVVDDETRIRDELIEFLSISGHTVLEADRPSEALRLMDVHIPDIVILDIRLPESDGLEVLEQIKQSWPDIEVIMITGHGDMDSVIRALRSGASDFFTKPLRLHDILGAIERTRRFLELNKRLKTCELNYSLLSQNLSDTMEHGIVAESPAMKSIMEMMTRVARSDDTTVLVTGESGTGKELVARGIHQLSTRKDARFCSVNMAAVPAGLFESEFFGHKKGAFSGASKDKSGWFEIAGKSTLFMDEICEMDPALQAKLLRVLEERTIVRLGSHEEIPVDVRLIAATNWDIDAMAGKNNFRTDLYMRLNTFRIHIPPLRDRKEDIPGLLETFLRFYASRINRPIDAVDEKAVEGLMQYAFPGNVRELKNMVEQAVILCDGPRVTLRHFPSVSREMEACPPPDKDPEIFDLALVEKKLITRVLKKTGGNKSEASRLLNISRQSLDRRIVKFGLSHLL